MRVCCRHCGHVRSPDCSNVVTAGQDYDGVMGSQRRKTRGAKERIKREENPLCCGWEGSEQDNATSHNSEFRKHQRAKEEFSLNCRCLDVRNIIVSSHLLSEPCSRVAEGGRVEGGTLKEDGMEKLTAYPNPSHRVKSPKQPHTTPRWERFNESNAVCALARSQTSSEGPLDQNISCQAQSPKSQQQTVHTHIKRQRQRRQLLPLTWSIESPASSGVACVKEQSVENQDEDLAVPWRCRMTGNPVCSRFPSRTLPTLQNTDRASGCDILKQCQRISSRLNPLKCVTSANGAEPSPVEWRWLHKPIGDNGAPIRVGQPEHRPRKDSHVLKQRFTSHLHNNCGSSLAQRHHFDMGLYDWAKHSSGTPQEHVQKDRGSRGDHGGVDIQINKEASRLCGEPSTGSWDSESQKENEWRSESYKTTYCDVTVLDIVRSLQRRTVNLSPVRKEGHEHLPFRHINHNIKK
ncbi:hypothetical protein DPEC_G00075080 [Dallia pectoralis]|uniref:Uncharacterized protein n=1 Tax=Dallia pectoralis TaxID=75939 RepID=A0ACC2H337_DALPE|nr:hypothetical protein DPEC_G00075080 [Dallia pectoralis]